MPFIIIGIIVLIIFFAFLSFKNPKVLGERGENQVKRIIGKTVENEQYVINNLTLVNDGKTSQIDHIVINPRGIFVIETKNYSGRIYGSEKQLEWTQVLSYGKVKNKFYNPLKQNATHVYIVKKLVEKLPVRSVVVFVQNNTEHIDAPNVIPLYILRNVLNQGESILSPEQMRNAYNMLLSQEVDISRQEHILNIYEQKINLERGICPRCGGKLVLRKGKYGEFWGCSNYPKCKFIKKS